MHEELYITAMLMFNDFTVLSQLEWLFETLNRMPVIFSIQQTVLSKEKECFKQKYALRSIFSEKYEMHTF